MGRGEFMRYCCLVRGRLNRITLMVAFLLAVVPHVAGAQSQTTPAITVTVNKSMVFRLAERAKRVSVSQPEVADVLVVAPSQLFINGNNVGTTSLIIFDEKGEVSNEVVYDRVLEVVATYLPPKPPATVAPSTSTSFTVGTSPIATIASSGTGFAGGGSLAFNEETSITDTYRWNDKKKIDGIIDLLVIREMRQIELDVVVADVSVSKLRDIGF